MDEHMKNPHSGETYFLMLFIETGTMEPVNRVTGVGTEAMSGRFRFCEEVYLLIHIFRLYHQNQ